MLKASNSKNLVNEAYLVVEDGYEKAPSEHLKYPHHKLKGNELVVDEAGVIAAFQRASQQGIVSGAVKAHLLKHYRELGLSTENFDEKEGQAEMAKKIEEEKLEEEKKTTENMSAEDNKEKNKEELDKKEEVDMGCHEEDMEENPEDKKPEEIPDNNDKDKDDDKDENDDDDDKKEVDYESKIAEYESKIAEMENDKNTYMEELEGLRKYKAEREEADKNFAIEEVFAQISEIMPKDKIDELREEAKSIEFSAIDGFKNKVKAIAFEYTSANKDVKSNRMAIVNVESKKARKPFDWYE